MAEGRFIDSALRAGKQAWRRLAPQSLRRYAQPLVGALSERRVWDALASPEPTHQPGPLIVSGLISETKGISEAARLTLAGLRAAGYSPFVHDLRPLLDAGPGARACLPVDRPGGVWIAHVNAPDALHALAYLDPAAWRGRYRIGYWAWELPRLPPDWVRASSAFHEIWAPSRFVAEAMAASGVKIPVRVMPHPVALGPSAATPDRTAFQIPANDFVALALGDLRSSATRKNLIGAIEVFFTAFPSVSQDAAKSARLIVKIQSDDAHPGFRAAAEKVADGRADIVFFADSLPTADMRRLIASCDVILSPHRSEGFGLPLAEAFLFGVPALATGWSGNLDFMGEISELLIQHTLVPVRDPFGVYRGRGLSWAEPDIADGAAKLAALAASPDLRRKLAARGRAAVEAQLADWSPERLRATALGGLVG